MLYGLRVRFLQALLNKLKVYSSNPYANPTFRDTKLNLELVRKYLNELYESTYLEVYCQHRVRRNVPYKDLLFNYVFGTMELELVKEIYDLTQNEFNYFFNKLIECFCDFYLEDCCEV